MTGVTENRFDPEFFRIEITRLCDTGTDNRCEFERFDFIDEDGVSNGVDMVVLEPRRDDD